MNERIGIADPAVFPRHRAGQDGAAADRQPAAHDQFVACLEFFDEPVGLGKIVAVVGVAHENPFAGAAAMPPRRALP